MLVIFLLSLFILLLLLPRIINNPIIGISILVFLLPFERIPSYDLPFFWGITVRLSQIVGIILIFSFIFDYLKRKIKIKIDLQSGLFLLYLFISLCSIFVSGNKERALMVWFFITFVIILSLVISFYIKSKNDLEKIKKYLFITTLIITIFGTIQFIGSTFGIPDNLLGLRVEYGEWTKKLLGFPRVQAFSLEPLYYANFLLIPFAIFFMLASRKENIKKYLWILFLISLNLVLTFSRGIYITGIATLLLSLFFVKDKIFSKKLFKIYGVIFLGIIIAFLMIGASTYSINRGFSKMEEAKKHAIEINENSRSVKERKISWENAIKAFKENPILGIGIGNFGPWEAGFPKDIPKGGWNIVNNETLEVLAETGILGFLSLVFALGYLFFKSIKAYKITKDKYLKAWLGGLVLSLIGIVIQYQSFSTLYITHIWVAIGLLVAVQNLVINENIKSNNLVK